MATKKTTVKSEQTSVESKVVTKPTDSVPTEQPAKKPAKKQTKKEVAASAVADPVVVAPVDVPAVVPADAPVDGEVEGDKRQRYFKCEYNKDSFGRYCGLKPKQAANKALTSIIRSNGGNDKCIDKTFRFEMIECTRGGNKKRSIYEGVRTRLPKPLVVNIKSESGAKTITYKFTNKLKKVKDPNAKQAGGKKPKKTPKPSKKAAETPVVAVAAVEEAKPVEEAKAVVEPKPAKKAASKKAPSKKVAVKA